jgi:hypothetical protein
MTPADKFLAEVKARSAAATPGPFMGRTEEWGTDLLWTVYQGESGKDGFKGKQPIAAFRDHADAAQFIFTDITRLIAMVDAARKALEFYKEHAMGAGIATSYGMNDDGFRAQQALAELDNIVAGGEP